MSGESPDKLEFKISKSTNDQKQIKINDFVPLSDMSLGSDSVHIVAHDAFTGTYRALFMYFVVCLYIFYRHLHILECNKKNFKIKKVEKQINSLPLLSIISYMLGLMDCNSFHLF